MSTYNYNDLEVIGCLGQYEKRKVPFVISGTYALKNEGKVLLPPYQEGGSSVQVGEHITRERFYELVKNEEATLFESPLPARRDMAAYVAIGSGPIEYIPLTEALEHIVNFSDQHRRLGDDYYLIGNLKEAMEEYILTASASQEAEDFARILLCNLPATTRDCYEKRIQNLGDNPDKLMEKVRKTVIKLK